MSDVDRFESSRRNTIARHILRIGSHWAGGAVAVWLLPLPWAIVLIALMVLQLAADARELRRIDISSIQYEGISDWIRRQSDGDA